MNIKSALADFKKKADLEIKDYLGKAIKEVEKKDELIADALRYVRKIVLAGGKRLRPAFMYWGYVGAGGKDFQRILKTSVSIELIHTFLLIHDDIIDADCHRHGMDTINFRYAKLGGKYWKYGDKKHFGDSMGIIIGDMVGALSNQIIFQSGFPPELVMKALHKLQGIVSLTVIGQARDVAVQYQKNVITSEDEVLKTYEYKTAKYTIEGPLHLGAILGGAQEEVLQKLNGYAVPVGIAFQIQDDILGIFGSRQKLGKPLGSDIKEGKATLLAVKSWENASQDQQRKLSEIFGKQDIGAQDINDFKKIAVATGALAYSNGLAKSCVEKGKRALENLAFKKEAKDFLAATADFIIEREI